ncbi:hypothetical protein [Dehalobacter sp.]|jgi:hypothetical protein|uniref:hypothetical protein n=1 Tax=Dehalobacter sp. TaxID=1962289 RepID=UPI000AE7E0BD|nr:hypothetical protein [Dehalobacter sp.]MCG1024936.1 hypothetical protein [Dehalobacter sp.]
MLTKKLLSLGICMLILFSFSTPLLAAEANTSSPLGVNYVYINKASSTLSISNGTASINGYVQKTPSGTSIQLTSTLQRYSSGSWATVASWSTTSASSSASISQIYTVYSGTYRVATSYSVSGPNGTESGTVYSTTETY